MSRYRALTAAESCSVIQREVTPLKPEQSYRSISEHSGPDSFRTQNIYGRLFAMQHNEDGTMEPDEGHVLLTDRRKGLDENWLREMSARETAEWLSNEKIAACYRTGEDADAVIVEGPQTHQYNHKAEWTLTMRTNAFVGLLAEHDAFANHLLSSPHRWQRSAAQRALGRD